MVLLRTLFSLCFFGWPKNKIFGLMPTGLIAGSENLHIVSV